MKRFLGLLLAGIFLLPVAGMAGDSIYSLRGIGVLYDYSGGRAISMGNAGVAVADSAQLNWGTPAALTELRRVTLASQFFIQNLRTANQKAAYWTGYANFFGLYGAFPIGHNIAFGFGLKPISKVDFRFEDSGEVDGTGYLRTISGRGGLNRFYFEGGFRPFKFLRVGAGVGYVFGKTDEDLRVNYASGDFVPTYDQYRSKYSGTNAHVALQVRPLRYLQLGVYHETGFKLSKTVEIRKINPSNQRAKTMASVNSSLRIPQRWKVGFAYRPNARFLLAADYSTQDWSAYGNETGESVDRDEGLGTGVEFLPLGRYDQPFYTHLAYRAGFRWNKSYLTDFAGKRIEEWMITAGIGVPFLGGMGVVDIDLEYGRRGSLSRNTFEENLFRLSIVVTGSEWWFVR